MWGWPRDAGEQEHTPMPPPVVACSPVADEDAKPRAAAQHSLRREARRSIVCVPREWNPAEGVLRSTGQCGRSWSASTPKWHRTNKIKPCNATEFQSFASHQTFDEQVGAAQQQRVRSKHAANMLRSGASSSTSTATLEASVCSHCHGAVTARAASSTAAHGALVLSARSAQCVRVATNPPARSAATTASRDGVRVPARVATSSSVW